MPATHRAGPRAPVTCVLVWPVMDLLRVVHPDKAPRWAAPSPTLSAAHTHRPPETVLWVETALSPKVCLVGKVSASCSGAPTPSPRRLPLGPDQPGGSAGRPQREAALLAGLSALKRCLRPEHLRESAS